MRDDYLDRIERNRRDAADEYDPALESILPARSGSMFCACGRVKERDRQVCELCRAFPGEEADRGVIFVPSHNEVEP